MYSAKSISKEVKNGALHVTVEYTDDSGKPPFQETYWANSGVDPHWLRNRVNSKLHEVNTLMELNDNFELGDIPAGFQAIEPSEDQLWAQDVFRLKQMKEAISLGLMEPTDKEFDDMKKKVKQGFKKSYVSSVRLV